MLFKKLITSVDDQQAYLRRELAGYEQAVVDQARGIVAGRSTAQPSPEHLRVLLQWLDGHATGAAPRVTH